MAYFALNVFGKLKAGRGSRFCSLPQGLAICEEVSVTFDVCRMNPSMGLAVRARAVELCRMPSLAILLTLEHAHNNPEGMF
jgi:hypothetical protein